MSLPVPSSLPHRHPSLQSSVPPAGAGPVTSGNLGDSGPTRPVTVDRTGADSRKGTSGAIRWSCVSLLSWCRWSLSCLPRVTSTRTPFKVPPVAVLVWVLPWLRRGLRHDPRGLRVLSGVPPPTRGPGPEARPRPPPVPRHLSGRALEHPQLESSLGPPVGREPGLSGALKSSSEGESRTTLSFMFVDKGTTTTQDFLKD